MAVPFHGEGGIPGLCSEPFSNRAKLFPEKKSTLKKDRYIIILCFNSISTILSLNPFLLSSLSSLTLYSLSFSVASLIFLPASFPPSFSHSLFPSANCPHYLSLYLQISFLSTLSLFYGFTYHFQINGCQMKTFTSDGSPIGRIYASSRIPGTSTSNDSHSFPQAGPWSPLIPPLSAV